MRCARCLLLHAHGTYDVVLKQLCGGRASCRYDLAATRPECFHDVLRGDNRCPFAPLWQNNTCDCATCDGFEAAPGWDPVTGLGSPNVTCILEAVRALPSPLPLPAPPPPPPPPPPSPVTADDQ